MLRSALEGFHMAIPDGGLNDAQETSEYDIYHPVRGSQGLLPHCLRRDWVILR